MAASFVLDNSVSMAWCFKDQGGDFVETVLDSLAKGEAFVPGIWPLEVANVLSRAERRKIIKRADSVRFIDLLNNLPIEVVQDSQRVFGEILDLSREHGLSSYDASYLDLAMRNGLPLVTLDEKLRKVAQRVGVVLFDPKQYY